ncbi:tannase and feruloyl esterase [Aspergillus saccharolyticus JOP 1030-1]|uniref:Carboxylic ester hydrolase n=1 Tax=Aspergillus saccharolyticus JOP 1030-1 TaxID=1450539 RepID=A0A318ZFJ3_9EURO|nr:tannase and feruloyl esterase [Aspergillus saccharolyticus JOP 1030-1]PYH45467.1 tannase and feruloyl esterase [Aspergillus saccharolyticus JOP 1030-1]
MVHGLRQHVLPPLDNCNVNITLTHPGENDTVLVEVWLPLDAKDWNGRFLATGGVAFPQAIKANEVAEGLLLNFASRSMHDMVVVGKAMTEQYFAKKPTYSTGMDECDLLDGLEDGVIDEPMSCTFDSLSLVGKTVSCDNGANKTITSTAAKVVKKIYEGPRPDGATIGIPMPIGASRIQNFLKKDPKFDLVFQQSVAKYETIIGTGNADLYAFRAAGGKMLSWHGLADDVIFAQGTIDYRQKVEHAMGGSAAVNDFYRLFLVPGGAHCVPGTGVASVSSDAFQALTLDARWTTNGVERRRKLCPYPLIARYNGVGDPASADSFSCVDSSYKSEERSSSAILGEEA